MNDVTRPSGPAPRDRAAAWVAATVWRSRPGRSTTRKTASVAERMAEARPSSSSRGRPHVGVPSPACQASSRTFAASEAAIRPRTTDFASAPAAIHARRSRTPSGDAALVPRTATSDPRTTPEARSVSRSRWTRRTSSEVRRSDLFTTTTCRSSRGSHDRRNSSWSTASAYFSGSATHATASTSGSRASTRARCSVTIESMSGRSRIATGPKPVDSCSRVSRTSSHSSSGARASRSTRGTHAIGSEVVGRRADAGLTSPPARALSRLDLPTPVPPTRART